MAQVLALSLAPVLSFAVVLRLVEWLRGWREVRFSVTAWLGLIGYIAYHISLESYRIGQTLEQQIALWQIGLVAAFWIFAWLLSVITGRGILRHPLSLMVLLAAPAMLFIPMSAPAVQKLAEWFLALSIFAVCLEAYLRLPDGDAMGKAIWAVTMVATAITVIEIGDCQLLNGIDLPRSEGSRCGQLYGALVSWLPAIGTTLAMGLVIFNHDRLERA